MAAQEDDQQGAPPLSLGDARLLHDLAERPWAWRLALFLRTLAVVELAKGLLHWGLLVGAGGAAEPLVGKTAAWFVATVFFAIADPVAAVGLWIGAPWGVAIWLIAALGQFAFTAAGGPTPGGWAVIAALLAAMALYVTLSIKARAEAR
ncbi:DUF6163 family protein [Hansschlegelia zhihuaiae]|uniref:DoxX family protein n=1 Tax=Hansschlegelia zhihuaiae TaxID=405005 RepID=A0A4Q0MLX6_9HYPH|nr:DUF6163 family protein [Hansschlegelia zhihuaiae]RXF74751.1 hypothetical protein EK403_05075 [Hansschlegelia zhihuaiae]